MNCTTSQNIIRKLHGSEQEVQSVGETHMDLAVKHMASCATCQTWFEQNMCPLVQNNPTEELRMLHGMLHEGMGKDDCYTP